jgi:hypothetical protein
LHAQSGADTLVARAGEAVVVPRGVGVQYSTPLPGGFRDCQVIERSFRWRFSSAEALFEHGFFRLAFIPPWHALVREEERKAVFDELEARLEARAVAEGELSLTIPFACFDCGR